jgi:hypothetical protein
MIVYLGNYIANVSPIENEYACNFVSSSTQEELELAISHDFFNTWLRPVKHS